MRVGSSPSVLTRTAAIKLIFEFDGLKDRNILTENLWLNSSRSQTKTTLRRVRVWRLRFTGSKLRYSMSMEPFMHSAARALIGVAPYLKESLREQR